MHSMSQSSTEIELNHMSLPSAFPRANLSCKSYKIMKASERSNINDWKTAPVRAVAASVWLYRAFSCFYVCWMDRLAVGYCSIFFPTFWPPHRLTIHSQQWQETASGCSSLQTWKHTWAWLALYLLDSEVFIRAFRETRISPGLPSTNRLLLPLSEE